VNGNVLKSAAYMCSSDSSLRICALQFCVLYNCYDELN